MKFFQIFCTLLLLSLMSTSCAKKAEKTTVDINATLDKVIDKTAQIGEEQADRMGSLIKKFQSETDAFERFKLCQQISLGSLSQSLKAIKDETKKEPRKYEKEIEMAGDYCQNSMNKITLFEQGLSDFDWGEISSGIKDSNLLKTRRFLSRAKDCSEADISKVINTGDKVFQQVTTMASLMAIIDSKEQRNLDKYFPRYKALVESSNHPDKGFLLKYLNYYGDIYRNDNIKKRDRQMLEDRTQRLAKEGVLDIKDASAKALNLAPHCFAGISMSAINNAKIVFNKKRMVRLRDFLSKKNIEITDYLEVSDEQSDWFELKFEKREELEKAGLEFHDVYGRPLYLRPHAGRVQVFSMGKDKRANTEDDQII